MTQATPGGSQWAAAGLVPLAAMWGSSFVFIGIAVPALGVFGVSEARAALGGAAVAVAVLVSRRRLQFRQSLRRYVMLGALASAGPYLLMSYATEQQGAALTAIFFATVPLFSVLIEWSWFGVQPRARALLGLLLGLAGVALIVTTSTQGGTGVATGAYAAALGAAMCSALGGNYANRHFGDEDPLLQSLGQSATAAALMVPVVFLAPPRHWPDATQTAATIGLGVVCTAIAYTLFFWLIGRLGPTRAMTVELMVPAFAALWGWLALNEHISAVVLLGAAGVVCGCALAMSRPDQHEPTTLTTPDRLSHTLPVPPKDRSCT
jgi:drug/metabolite transporter (DMT)-like permease